MSLWLTQGDENQSEVVFDCAEAGLQSSGKAFHPKEYAMPAIYQVSHAELGVLRTCRKNRSVK